MSLALAPWLAVRPTDYLAASQAGANVGLSIARMRQATDERNLKLRADAEENAANRQAQADRLREQLAQQRDLKLQDMAIEQQRANQDLMKSQASLDMQSSALDFRKSQEEFQQEQQGLKLRSAADASQQEANLLRGVASDSTPEGIAKTAANNPLAKSSPAFMQHGLTLAAQKQTRADEITNPRPTADMRNASEGMSHINNWINGGSEVELNIGSKLLGLTPDSLLGRKKSNTPGEDITVRSKVQALMLLRQKAETPEKQKEIDSMIENWRKEYPDLFGGSAPSLQMNPRSGPSLPSTNTITRLRWTPQGLQPIQ